MTAPSRINGRHREAIDATCAKKNRYADMHTAIAMGASRSEVEGYQLYCYRCPVCAGWHLTRSNNGRNGNPSIPCKLEVFETKEKKK